MPPIYCANRPGNAANICRHTTHATNTPIARFLRHPSHLDPPTHALHHNQPQSHASKPPLTNSAPTIVQCATPPSTRRQIYADALPTPQKTQKLRQSHATPDRSKTANHTFNHSQPQSHAVDVDVKSMPPLPIQCNVAHDQCHHLTINKLWYRWLCTYSDFLIVMQSTYKYELLQRLVNGEYRDSKTSNKVSDKKNWRMNKPDPTHKWTDQTQVQYILCM